VFVSVVVPLYDEAPGIEALAAALTTALEPWDNHEIIFVDDGSRDGSLEILRELHRKDQRLRYLSFSRNFGHQTALRAGLDASGGDCIITMDGDFQHPPGLIPEMIEKYRKGFDIVTTRRREVAPGKPGSLSLFKRASSRFFYAMVNSFSDIRIEPGSADFRLLSRKARACLLSMKEHNLFLRGAIPWMGLPSAELEYEAAPRRYGSTKYSLAKMWSLAIDGITSFSVRPLRITSFAGAVISLSGFVYALYAIFIRLFTSNAVEGWTSLLISVLIIGGIQLLSLGIIGEYLGKLFMEAKGRPHYILKEASPAPREVLEGEIR